MKKNLHIILTLVLTPVLFYLILEYGWTYVYCGQLSGYDYDDFKIIGGLIKLVLVFLAICGGGTLDFCLTSHYTFFSEFQLMSRQRLTKNIGSKKAGTVNLSGLNLETVKVKCGHVSKTYLFAATILVTAVLRPFFAVNAQMRNLDLAKNGV